MRGPMHTVSRSTKVINTGTAAQALLPPADDADHDTGCQVGEQPELPDALRRQLLCRLLPVLTLGYGLSFIDRSNIAYAELEMGHAIGIDARTFGLASGIFFAGYGPMQIPVVHLVARVGARRVLAGTLFVWGLLASLMGSVDGPASLCVLRFCLGLAEAGYYPGALYFLSTWLPSELNGTAAAMFTCLGIPMAVIGSLSSGAILTYPLFDCLLGLEAWRWLFILQGAPAVLLSVVLLCQLPDTPATSRWLSAEHRHLLTSKLTQQPTEPRTAAPCAEAATADLGASSISRGMPAPPLTLRRGLCLTLPRLATWVFVLQHFAGCTIAYVVMFFSPMFLNELLPSWSPLSISLLQSSTIVVSTPARPPPNRNRNRPGTLTRTRIPIHPQPGASLTNTKSARCKRVRGHSLDDGVNLICKCSK